MPIDTTSPVIDTHNHYWRIGRSDMPWLRPEMTVLHRSYTPEDLKPHLDAVGVERAVIVEAAHGREDNLWWLELADEHPHVAAVVGWVDLEDPAVGARLDEYGARAGFRGVRAGAEDVADPGWLARPEVLRGLGEVERRGLVLDLLVRTEHLHHVPMLAARFPALPMVIDHLAKPPIAAGELDAWYAGMERVAAETDVRCKVSGLLTEAGDAPTTEAIRPVVRFAIDRFGPERLMWGSDWPVSLQAAPYEETYRTVTATLDGLTAPDRALVLGGNAVRFYGL